MIPANKHIGSIIEVLSGGAKVPCRLLSIRDHMVEVSIMGSTYNFPIENSNVPEKPHTCPICGGDCLMVCRNARNARGGNFSPYMMYGMYGDTYTVHTKKEWDERKNFYLNSRDLFRLLFWICFAGYILLFAAVVHAIKAGFQL